MVRGALHLAVVFSFLWLPLNRRHSIVLVYPIEDVGALTPNSAAARRLAG